MAAGRVAVLPDGAVSGVLGGLWEGISHLHKAMLLFMGLNFGKLVIPFLGTDFLFRRYQSPASPPCGAGTLKMALLPLVLHPPTLYTLSPLLKGAKGSGVRGDRAPMCRAPSAPSS